MRKTPAHVYRAQGSLLGQFAGDALGSLVEFLSPQEIRQHYPEGVRDLAAGGTWNTLAGQPTDDSEMALLLARMLVKTGAYDPQGALKEYRYWLDSHPFDCGNTISGALRGILNPQSQANGAMMRVSPLGIFGAKYALSQVAEWAVQDAALTHIHPVCQQANALFAMGIAQGVASGCTPEDLYEKMQGWVQQMPLESSLQKAFHQAAEAPPGDYLLHQGWVLVAFQNALWQMLHAPNLEEALVDTVMQGGDTDTNAAICGALLGALYGLEAIPSRWSQKILNCRPQAGNPGVLRPRPECFWPVDALELAEELVA